MILITKPNKDYELLDSGEGEKLERFGNVVLSRPDPQALWRKKMSEKEWKSADAIFSREGQDGKWKKKVSTLEKWKIDFAGLNFSIKPTAFKHTGLFPEQASNWEWMRGLVTKEINEINKKEAKEILEIEILNLFGYTGGATLVCAQAGAKVTHVDSSKSAITWARENAENSELKDKPIRWIEDDARDFVKREIKRERKYDAIIMDPPAFGHGPKRELWKIENDFINLVEDCIKLLSEKPLFFIINGYSAGYSAIAYENNLKILEERFGGKIEMGELAIEEKGEEKDSGRLLPCGIFARWSRG